MVWNEIDQIPQNLNYTAHAIKWEVIWLYEWGKAIITWSIDLLTFMIKYPFNSKYRQEINKQAEIIYDFVKKEWLSWVGNKVYEAVWKEMDRISKLPPEKQSQAIWEIAWNVISMLAVIKVGTTVASKLWKVGQAERLVGQAEATWNIARAEKVREIAQTLLASKRWLQSFEIILTWVAESVLLKWLSVSYKATLGFLENSHLSNLAKAELIEQKIQKARQMKWETPEEQQILERYIETLNKEKESLQRIDNLYNNPRYKFLEKYKEVLGENISVSDIVWEWTQAIIMKHPTNDRLVLKIAKPWEVDDIMQEFKNHNLFYEKWLELSYDWKIDKNIKVPQVLKWEVDWYFYMEKVDWQSLYSKTLIERYEKQLSPEELKTIWELDDKQVREFLKKRFKETDSYLDQIIEDYSLEHLLELMWNTYKIRKETWKIWWTPLDKAITSLRESWVIHNDLHPWNIMIDREWNIYIIDFWRIREFNK